MKAYYNRAYAGMLLFYTLVPPAIVYWGAQCDAKVALVVAIFSGGGYLCGNIASLLIYPNWVYPTWAYRNRE